MELAVNMPEQDPQVGQALLAMESSSESLTESSADSEMASMRSDFGLVTPPTENALPASIGPPETKTAGMFRRIAALSMPGVILSQLEMQTIASTVWALIMYSTESVMTSRDGRE